MRLDVTCILLTIPRRTPTDSNSRSRQPVKPMERLPQLSYGLLKEQALRKKLSELGIPNSGPRALLMKRHTEWVNLVNANCDSSRPRTKRELLNELDNWERSQGRNILNGLAGNETSSVMRKDFDGAAWASSHGNDFQQLIAKARRKPPATKERSDVDNEAETVRSPHFATTESPVTPQPNDTRADADAVLSTDASRSPNNILLEKREVTLGPPIPDRTQVIDLDGGP